MKKYVYVFMILVITMLTLTACGNKNTSNIEKNDISKGEKITEVKSVEVTNESGETVTNASGEAVTEKVAVEKVTKVETVKVTNKSGETVTDKSGEAVTEKKTVTEYVTVPTTKMSVTSKSIETTKTSTTTTTKKVEETTKPVTTKATTTTTTKPQETTTKSTQKTVADLPYRNPTSEETEIVNLINQARIEDGAQQLTFDPTLLAFADIRVKEFASNTDLAHSRPDGTKWSSIYKEYSVQNYGGGENLCMLSGTAVDATEIHQAFMDSPSHRNNLLGKDLTSCGIAIYRKVDDTGRTHVYSCEIFSSKPLQ